MADYQQMYAIIFRAVSKAIEELQKAQQMTEELYLSSEESVFELLPEKDEKKDDSP